MYSMTRVFGRTTDKSIFFQAEDGIRDGTVTGVQTCALPISFLAQLYRSRRNQCVGLGDLFTQFSGLCRDLLFHSDVKPFKVCGHLVERLRKNLYLVAGPDVDSYNLAPSRNLIRRFAQHFEREYKPSGEIKRKEGGQDEEQCYHERKPKNEQLERSDVFDKNGIRHRFTKEKVSEHIRRAHGHEPNNREERDQSGEKDRQRQLRADLFVKRNFAEK